MKKILVLLAVMLPLCAAAEDVVSLDGLNEPEWKSFVPPAYADVEEAFRNAELLKIMMLN